MGFLPNTEGTNTISGSIVVFNVKRIKLKIQPMLYGVISPHSRSYRRYATNGKFSTINLTNSLENYFTQRIYDLSYRETWYSGLTGSAVLAPFGANYKRWKAVSRREEIRET